jgi:hypothetical protein
MRTIRDLDARIADTAEPRSRQLLEALRRHMHAESVAPDPDALMAEFGDDPRIGTWGSSRRDHGATGRDAVRHIAERNCSRSWATAVEFRIDELVVDTHCIALEGEIRRRFPGSAFADLDLGLDPERVYDWTTMMAVFYSFDRDGRITAIDTYATGDVATRITPVTA